MDLNNNQKENQFISWITNKDVEFPFFKDIKEIKIKVVEDNKRFNWVKNNLWKDTDIGKV